MTWTPPSRQRIFDLIDEGNRGPNPLTPGGFLDACRAAELGSAWPELDQIVATAWRMKIEGLIEIKPRNLGPTTYVPLFDSNFSPDAAGLTNYFEQIYPTVQGRMIMRSEDAKPVAPVSAATEPPYAALDVNSLLPEQEALLGRLVEADRDLRPERDDFRIAGLGRRGGPRVFHEGLGDDRGHAVAPLSDFQELIAAGYLRKVRQEGRGERAQWYLALTSSGFHAYATLKEREGELIDRVEIETRMLTAALLSATRKRSRPYAALTSCCGALTRMRARLASVTTVERRCARLQMRSRLASRQRTSILQPAPPPRYARPFVSPATASVRQNETPSRR